MESRVTFMVTYHGLPHAQARVHTSIHAYAYTLSFHCENTNPFVLTHRIISSVYFWN